MDQFSAAAWEDILNDRFVPRRRRDGDVRSELKRRTVKLKADAGCYSFPTDVHTLARAVGIARVRTVPLPMQGRLIRDTCGVVAELNVELPSRKQRFVLAHEIAHMLVARDIASLGSTSIYGSTSTPRPYQYVERLCDFGAREILIPENALLKELRREPFSLNVIRKVAAEADCDPEVIAECICELPGRWGEMVFLFCRIAAHTSEVHRAIPGASVAFEVVDTPDSLLRRALNKTESVSGDQELWAGYNRLCVSAEALALDPKNVVLVWQRSN